MEEPWGSWIPGVLNKDQVRILCEKGLIIGKEPDELEEALDESSIDLSLSDEAFRMTEGSVKPSRSHAYSWLIGQLGARLQKSEDGTFKLNARETYVFKLRERLQKRLMDAAIYGQATAKSSVGRVDVLARLVVDGMDTYESFDPAKLENSNGDMYLEITPITFHVKVKPGKCLSQLRLFKGDPEDVRMTSKELFKTTLLGSAANDGSLSVDLTDVKNGGPPVAAFCGIENKPDDAIPLWKETNGKKPDPRKYWRLVRADERGRLKITESRFYLLRSKERIRVPDGIAIYCRASDETIGEMRIHYAGFVHPRFGTRRKDSKIGTPLMFEVRGHQVDVSLEDGEKMANLTFFRMSQDCRDGHPTPYEDQELELSSFFDPWPTKLGGYADGTVEPA